MNVSFLDTHCTLGLILPVVVETVVVKHVEEVVASSLVAVVVASLVAAVDVAVTSTFVPGSRPVSSSTDWASVMKNITILITGLDLNIKKKVYMIFTL